MTIMGWLDRKTLTQTDKQITNSFESDKMPRQLFLMFAQGQSVKGLTH